MISVAEAQAAIRGALSPVKVETCPLAKAAGRCLAAPVQARLTQPPFTASAMDGYAVKLADVATLGAKLKIIGVSSAGERFNGAVKSSAAVRIYTGAPLPSGADHVIIQEHVTRDGNEITVQQPQERSRNIRAAGIDFNKDEELLAAGARLNGPMLALTAAGNHTEVTVRRRPKVALIANGDELVPPGGLPKPDQIISSIPYGLMPMIENWGGAPEFLGIAPDDPAAIAQIVKQGFDYDLIVPVGGASVGGRDFMRQVFAELGFTSHFEKVSVKPGKPAWFGFTRDTPVIGLPGNPASALVTAILFIKPAICALLGGVSEPRRDCFTARLTTPLAANGPRETYLRGHIAKDNNGARIVTPHDHQDSSLLSIFAKSDALIKREANAVKAREGDVAFCLAI